MHSAITRHSLSYVKPWVSGSSNLLCSAVSLDLRREFKQKLHSFFSFYPLRKGGITWLQSVSLKPFEVQWVHVKVRCFQIPTVLHMTLLLTKLRSFLNTLIVDYCTHAIHHKKIYRAICNVPGQTPFRLEFISKMAGAISLIEYSSWFNKIALLW